MRGGLLRFFPPLYHHDSKHIDVKCDRQSALVRTCLRHNHRSLRSYHKGISVAFCRIFTDSTNRMHASILASMLSGPARTHISLNEKKNNGKLLLVCPIYRRCFYLFTIIFFVCQICQGNESKKKRTVHQTLGWAFIHSFCMA